MPSIGSACRSPRSRAMRVRPVSTCGKRGRNERIRADGAQAWGLHTLRGKSAACRVCKPQACAPAEHSRMSIPVTVLDYGIGNLLNVLRALEHCGATPTVIDKASPEAVNAPRLVLPGVGAFGDGMAELRARGLDDLVRRFAATGRPFLGICVGMQMMFEASEEMGEHAGLGLLAGRVKAIPATGSDGAPHPVPHLGLRPPPAARGRGGRHPAGGR